ncbi:hypothetical protein AURDEDRAFT_175733 [Auricularia subglabra TFB-10046 SS5]|uniref:F-box domain-containing protein n=1 Tax=Auricularia subglabra (strain TFB-10046 / SS5) TaxID=717982 RepID=J0WRB6_AURST|nr:hypothetical protein AURDEDRAFT_175733 [Auricularia subglabra TFB-10046 SS5]
MRLTCIIPDRLETLSATSITHLCIHSDIDRFDKALIENIFRCCRDLVTLQLSVSESNGGSPPLTGAFDFVPPQSLADLCLSIPLAYTTAIMDLILPGSLKNLFICDRSNFSAPPHELHPLINAKTARWLARTFALCPPSGAPLDVIFDLAIVEEYLSSEHFDMPPIFLLALTCVELEAWHCDVDLLAHTVWFLADGYLLSDQPEVGICICGILLPEDCEMPEVREYLQSLLENVRRRRTYREPRWYICDHSPRTPLPYGYVALFVVAWRWLVNTRFWPVIILAPLLIAGFIYVRGNVQQLSTRSNQLETAVPIILARTFDQLPPDIISEIMLSGDFSFKDRLAICAVSKFVRHVALSRSSFWSTIRVHSRADLRPVPLLLHRSRCAPLEVVLRAEAGARLADISHFSSRLATLIVPHRSRIRTLEIFIHDVSLVHDLVQSEFALEELVEVLICAVGLWSDHFPISIIAPRLRVLRIYGYITPRLESLAYTSLRVLVLQLPPTEMTTELLNAVFNGCTSLRELALGIIVSDDDEVAPHLGRLSSTPPRHLEFLILNLPTELSLVLLDYLPLESINIIQLHARERFSPKEGDSVHPMLRCLATGGSRLSVETAPEDESQWPPHSGGPAGGLAFWLSGTDERAGRPDPWYYFDNSASGAASRFQNPLRDGRGAVAGRGRGLVLAHDDWEEHGYDIWEHLCLARVECPQLALESFTACVWHTHAFARHVPRGANITASFDLAMTLCHAPDELNMGRSGHLAPLRIPALTGVRLLPAKYDGELLNRAVAFLAVMCLSSKQPTVEICVCAVLPPTNWSTARALAEMQFSLDNIHGRVRRYGRCPDITIPDITICNHWVNGLA